MVKKGLPRPFLVHALLQEDSYARPGDDFFEPKTYSDVEAVFLALEGVGEGAVLACRGRDYVSGSANKELGRLGLWCRHSFREARVLHMERRCGVVAHSRLGRAQTGAFRSRETKE